MEHRFDPGSVRNAERITSVFGRWPAFHDAELHRISLDRSGPEGPSLTAVIHVFETLPTTDAQGFLDRTRHTLVTLRLADIRLWDLQDFNGGNVVFDLMIRDWGPDTEDGYRFKVEMSSSYGCTLDCDCREVIVVSAEPYAPG